MSVRPGSLALLSALVLILGPRIATAQQASQTSIPFTSPQSQPFHCPLTLDVGDPLTFEAAFANPTNDNLQGVFVEARITEQNATNLATGLYLYRLFAQTTSATLMRTGRMMLMK